jgi:hypothetical protein
MVRTEAATQNEIAVFQMFCLENGIILDGETGFKNGEILGQVIADSNQQITPATLAVAFEQVRDQLAIKSSAELAYEKIAAENPYAAAALDALYPRELISDDPDKKFHNSTKLLVELRGRPVNSRTVDEALGRLNYKPGSNLHFIPSKPVVDPRNHALRTEEPKPTSQIKYVGGRKNHASDPVETQTQVKSERQIDAWETISRSHLGSGRTHSQSQALQHIFDRGVNGMLPWRQVATQMGELKKIHETGF